jgi:hypothetical protein
MCLARAVRLEDPVVQTFAADAERIRETLIRPGDAAVE